LGSWALSEAKFLGKAGSVWAWWYEWGDDGCWEDGVELTRVNYQSKDSGEWSNFVNSLRVASKSLHIDLVSPPRLLASPRQDLSLQPATSEDGHTLGEPYPSSAITYQQPQRAYGISTQRGLA